LPVCAEHCESSRLVGTIPSNLSVLNDEKFIENCDNCLFDGVMIRTLNTGAKANSLNSRDGIPFMYFSLGPILLSSILGAYS